MLVHCEQIFSSVLQFFPLFCNKFSRIKEKPQKTPGFQKNASFTENLKSYASILGMWSGNLSTHSTYQNFRERNRVSLFFLSCKWFSLSGFQTMLPSENQIYRKIGQSVKEILEMWAKEEEPMFPSLTIRFGKWSSTCKWSWFFFTCVNQKLTSLSKSTCSDPHAKINQVICFIHGPIVSATVLVPTLNLCISQGHTKIKHSSSFLSIPDGAKWIRGVFPLISVGFWGLDFLLWCVKQLKVKNTPF